MTTLQLVTAVTKLAIQDCAAGVKERAACNTGGALFERVGIVSGFKGDSKYLRMVYTAAYWWEGMKDERAKRFDGVTDERSTADGGKP